MITVGEGNYRRDRCIIDLHEGGKVTVSREEFAPTEAEALAIKEELAGIEWPKTIRARNLDGLEDKVGRGPVFEFVHRPSGEIIMAQEQLVGRGGVKRFRPWVMMNDGEWVAMEPDGGLPFWKPRVARKQRIMVHEGAKCAIAAEAIANDPSSAHPWAKALAEYEHWGQIGGAYAAHRTDYDELKREEPIEVVYFCDNDSPGAEALETFSRCWGRSLKAVRPGKKFPPSWDIADPMPKELFKRGRYQGEPLEDIMWPATWATRQIPNPSGKGRPVAVLTEEFADEWLHCVQPEVFLHRDWPDKLYSSSDFNNVMRPFSHVKEGIDKLLQGKIKSKAAELRYEPALKPGVYSGANAGMYINIYKPSSIKPEKGDPGPWLEFMEHLFPVEEDRIEMYRWCATLVCRPDIRPHYGCLLMSVQQGVGKSTLGQKVLIPLVGKANASEPNEEMIVESAFDYWSPYKRLAVVHEIYAGHSSKAYNKMKSKLVDDTIEVNQKYMPIFRVRNHLMVLACSNTELALKIAADDRRWFVPTVTDQKCPEGYSRPGQYWDRINDWLSEDGGLQIVRWWLEEWLKTNDFAGHGSEAPASSAKRNLIEEGYSPGQRLVMNVLEMLKQRIREGGVDPDIFILDHQLVDLVRTKIWEGKHSQLLERPGTLRAIAKSSGMTVGATRVQIKGWGPEAAGSFVLSWDEKIAAISPVELCGERITENQRRQPFDLMNFALSNEHL